MCERMDVHVHKEADISTRKKLSKEAEGATRKKQVSPWNTKLFCKCFW
jgi:hypothetical protein